MHATAPPTRRTWPWIVGAAILIGALIIAGAVYFGIQAGTAIPTADPTTPTASSLPSPSTTPVDAEPNGCLGGETRDAAMILAAQQAAPHTTNGAVDFAASFVRWIQRFPYPAADDAAAVGDSAMARESFTNDLVSYLAAEPDLSGGIVPLGEGYYMSTVPGVWVIESASNDRVEVTIGTAFVVNGALSATLKSSITVVAVWEDGQWKIADANGTRTTEDLYSVGRPFAEGC
ncbi:hypothetical protein [Cryobacterium sp. PH31-O1]|uniref:hypothetical protein n=1 Tax=Cryobacterium sp. PH31-O1 TaxID=3046306 RepID=UPI0024B9BE46|nr:hypothetical protein [Cryobacterium sp. PH31-O1]MDJ0337945.1 hypothetical protein [Cryobacterium sp. PH31-O1]